MEEIETFEELVDLLKITVEHDLKKLQDIVENVQNFGLKMMTLVKWEILKHFEL
jgi:hypothetical protein